MLARLHLRLRPVDAENLRPAGLQLAEIFVEGGIDRLLAIAIADEILADGFVPVARLLAREDAAHAGGAARTDLRLGVVGHGAGPERLEVDAGNDAVAALAPGDDLVDLAAHVILDRGEDLARIGELRLQLALGFPDGGRQIADDE